MFPSLGNERFDMIHGQSVVKNFKQFVNATVIDVSANMELIPGLANSWSVSEDGFVWTFDFDTLLEPGIVKFHDGSTMVIEDIVWTFEQMMGKGCVEHCTSTYLPDPAIATDFIRKTGPYQMTIQHNIADSGFAIGTMSSALSRVRGVVPARPLVWDTQQELDFDKNPTWAGKMSFIKHIPAERIELERFDEFYYHPDNGFPEDRRMKYSFADLLIVPELATRAAALKAGDGDVGIVSLETKDQVEAGGGKVVFSPEGVYWWVQFPQNWATGPTEAYPNWKVSPFGDKRVRQALGYAIDKELMMERLYGGPEVAVAKGWAQITPSTIGYSPDLDPLPYDPDKARQLLVDAGYPDGDGFGKVIVNTWNSETLPKLPESAQVAADYWRRELNLDVEVRVGESASTRQAFRAGTIQGQIVWRENETKVDGMGSTRFYFGLPGPVMPFHQDPELFERVQETMAINEPVAREKSINDLHKILWELQHAVGIGFVNIPWGVGPIVKTWQPRPLSQQATGLYTMTLFP